MKDLKARAEGTCSVSNQMCEVSEAQGKVLTPGRERTRTRKERKTV